MLCEVRRELRPRGVQAWCCGAPPPGPTRRASGQGWADEASPGITLSGPHPAPAEPGRGRGGVQALRLPTPSSHSAGQVSVLGGEQGYEGGPGSLRAPPLPSCIPG